MSWVKALSFSGEDVFDENADDFDLMRRDWMSNMKKRVRDGYVDGADFGEDSSLQVGFNIGFKEGAAQTAAVSRLKGIVSAINCWCQIQHPKSPSPASVTALLQQITQYEDTIVDGLRKALENPPPTVTSVSESMEDLEVKPADQGCCGGGCKETGCCGEGCKETGCCGGGCKETGRCGEGCKETGCCGGGCKETGCCRGGEKMDLQETPSSGPSDCSSSLGLNYLLQRGMDLVSELGLPQEVISYIQELKDM